MHLRGIELTGFKSFAEAKIEFPKGITAVVGPNGTGKSNLVDAILWVLGEQSAKTLRSERMEDVIFNGTEARKPLGMAEVSLVMSGVDAEKLSGILTLSEQLKEFHEVMVTRRLYRNGDSEYLINKTPCRLKDIRSLFLETRAGTKGHTIIEQGRIEQILNASPQERRELIEETAGIVRYKKQKAEALRKLEFAQQNLVRVRDIINEVRRQLNSLERQAKQARSYQALQEEARRLEIRLLVHECRALVRNRASVEADLASLKEQEAAQLAEQARLTREVEEARLKCVTHNETLMRVREALGRLEHEQAQALAAAEVENGKRSLYEHQRVQAAAELERLAQEREQSSAAIVALQERLSADRRELAEHAAALSELETMAQALSAQRAADAEEEERVRREIIDLTVQVTSGENNLARLVSREAELRRRLDRLANEQAEMEAQRASTIERLHETSGGREQSERTIQELQGEAETAVQEQLDVEARLREIEQAIGRRQESLAAVESRLRALQGVLREEMGYGREGEEEATSLRKACAGIRESIAEWLVVPPGYERAVEAVLGDRVHAWLVDEPGYARQGVEFLKTRGLGRGAFVPVRPRYPHATNGQEMDTWWPALQGQRGVLGRALDLLRVEGSAQEAFVSLFHDIVFVEELEVALKLWDQAGGLPAGGPTFATLDGEVLEATGVLSGGAMNPSAGLLQRRSEIRRLEDEQKELSRALAEDRQVRDELLLQNESLKARVSHLQQTVRETEMRALACTKDETVLRQTIADLDRRIETIREERRIDEDEQMTVQRELVMIRDRIAQLTRDKEAREARLADLQTRLRRVTEESQALQGRITEAHAALASIKARLEHGEADVARRVEEQAERERRAVVLDQQLVSLEAAVQQSRAEQERSQALCQELARRADQIRQELVAAQEAQTKDSAVVAEIERRLESVRECIAAHREALTTVEVRRAEINTQLSVLESTLTGTYQLTLAQALAWKEGEPGQVGDGDGSEVPSEQEASEVEVLEIREQLQKVRERLERLGSINLAAIDEHRELEERYKFLTMQEEDLSRSVSGLKEIIARINRTTKRMFMDTFNELQQKFGEVFNQFFPGGRAELILTDQVQDPEEDHGSDEPGVDIVAQPPGKRLKNLAMLSGGEKTLTAMALIFASFLIRPTPFCILDEIDAPLDEENIGRFTAVLRDLAEGAQFIVITHNKRTMAVADSLFGVTMEEPGVSKLVSVRLADLQPA